MAKRRLDELLEPDESENSELTDDRGRFRRWLVDPDEREDYQEWLVERQDPKRRKVKPRRRREDPDLEPAL